MNSSFWRWIAFCLVLVSGEGVRADLTENFDASTAVPAGWTNNGTVNWNNASHYQSAPNCRALALGQSLQTPAVDYPTNLSFYVDASNAGNNKTGTVDYSTDGGTHWTLLGSFIATTAGSTKNFPLNSAPNLSASEGVRFRFNSTFNTWYLDNVVIRTGSSPFPDVPPMVNLDPGGTNQIVLLGETVTVAVVATETDGDEITLTGVGLPAGATFDPNPLVGVSPLTNLFEWTPAAVGVYEMSFTAEDKDGVDEVALSLYVYETDPTLLLSENFDASSAAPAGWVDSGTAGDSDATHYQSPPFCRALGAGDTLATPGVDFPTNISFYADASSAGNGQSAGVSYRVGEGEWLPLGSFTVRTAGAQVSFSLAELPEVYAATNVQFRFSSTFSTWYLDDVLIRGQRLSDRPPELSAIGPQIVAPGQMLNVEVVATDFDRDEITLFASNLPPGAVFDAVTNAGGVTNVLIYAPGEEEVGLVYTSTFYAVDIDGTTEETITITVVERLVSFATAGTTIWEGEGPPPVAVVLSRPADVSFDVALGGNATPGLEGDYVLVETHLVFAADGSTTQFLDLAILDDADREPTETLILTLTNAVGADIGPIGQHTMDIRDNEAALFDPFDVNPGWSVQGQWAFGRPLGGGGSYGYPDPSSGYTGTNVYGYNLAGDYVDNMASSYYLTTPAIDCSRFRNVHLQFARWLGVEGNSFDHAFVQVSLDRSNWVDVWRNGSSTIAEWNWTNVDYDLSAFADGESALYVRWGLGPTDVGWRYCGWNIDDVSLEGEYVTNALFRFSAAGYAARETSLVAQVTIERTGLTNGVAEIGWATSNRTATAGADYVAVEETLVFAPGERSRIVSVPLLDDLDVEGDETIGLHLISTASGEVLAPSEAVLILQDDELPGVGLPFFEGFETDPLSNGWAGASTDAGRIRVGSGSVAAFEGAGHVEMDSTDYNSYGLNELVLTANLSGQTNLVLDFQENNYDYGRETMPAQFMGSTNADGIAVSVDGLNWHRLLGAANTYYGYGNRSISLSAFAASNGLAMEANFKIKFQQYDRYPLPIYGRCFDNIHLYDPTQVADVRLSVLESEDPTTPGSNMVYTLVVTNAGPLGAPSVVVSNQLPSGIALVSANPSQGSCTQQEAVIFCDLGDLPPASSATVLLTVVPADLGVLTNRAWAAGDVFDPFRTNNHVTTTTVVDEQGGILQMVFDSMVVEEKAGTTTLGVIRTGPTYGAISVGYATSDGTAAAGADYAPTTGTLVFASGQTAAAIVIPIADDGLDEASETFQVSLSSPGGGAVLGDPLETSVSIADDDGRAAFPFYEPFESGSLTNYWRTYSTGGGRIAVTTNNGPYAGERHLTMDTPLYYSNALNELVLTVDLAGKQGVTLEFWQRHFGNVAQTMPATFTGHHNSDGVAISPNGTNWAKVQGLTAAEGSSNGYGRFEVALDAVVAANGWAYNSSFKIKFQQFDNYPIPYRGFGFDEISLFSRPGELRFSSALHAAEESAGVFTVNVERVNGSLGEVSVGYSTEDGTALAGSDYVATNGVLVFADGVTTGSFAIALIDDADDEAAESIGMWLGETTGGAVRVAPSNAVLTLGDNDGPGGLAFATNAYTVTESNGLATIVVRRLDGAEGEVSVDYATSDGTASNGLDYVATTGTLVFPAGVTQQEFTVATLDDAEREDAETIFLTLGNPAGGATVGEPGVATLTLLDDEDPNYDYYATAYGKEGAELRQALHDIIDGHTAFSYDTIWTILQETDECPTNAAQVQLVYMQIGRDENNHGAGSGQWNREHTWPQSHGFPDALSTTVPPSVDAHNLKPSDVGINALRGEKDFDDGGSAVAGAPPTCLTTADTFAPPDATKGDIARMMFYMDVRYSGDTDGEPDLELVDAINTSGTQLGKLSTLIRWHFQDPPDDFENRRNNLIHANWQGNRNPFIDHPEWVLKVWEYNLSIATVAGEHGTLTPDHPQVPYHDNQLFEVRPDPYYHIVDIRTNGTSLGAAYGTSSYSFVWGPVVSTGLVEAIFAENLAAQGTPEWWLADQGFATDFDAAELDDPDDDGFPTWKEYRAGTHPRDPLSFLQLEGIVSTVEDNQTVLRWQSASNRTYAIWKSLDLTGEFTNRLADHLPATPPQNVYTDAIDGLRLQFYLIEVEP